MSALERTKWKAGNWIGNIKINRKRENDSYHWDEIRREFTFELIWTEERRERTHLLKNVVSVSRIEEWEG